MHCWARYLLYALIATLGVGQMLSACGQKGDLYLPESAASTRQPPAADIPPESLSESATATDDVPAAPAAP